MYLKWLFEYHFCGVRRFVSQPLYSRSNLLHNIFAPPISAKKCNAYQESHMIPVR